MILLRTREQEKYYCSIYKAEKGEVKKTTETNLLVRRLPRKERGSKKWNIKRDCSTIIQLAMPTGGQSSGKYFPDLMRWFIFRGKRRIGRRKYNPGRQMWRKERRKSFSQQNLYVKTPVCPGREEMRGWSSSSSSSSSSSYTRLFPQLQLQVVLLPLFLFMNEKEKARPIYAQIYVRSYKKERGKKKTFSLFQFRQFHSNFFCFSAIEVSTYRTSSEEEEEEASWGTYGTYQRCWGWQHRNFSFSYFQSQPEIICFFSLNPPPRVVIQPLTNPRELSFFLFLSLSLSLFPSIPFHIFYLFVCSMVLVES